MEDHVPIPPPVQNTPLCEIISHEAVTEYISCERIKCDKSIFLQSAIIAEIYPLIIGAENEVPFTEVYELWSAVV